MVLTSDKWKIQEWPQSWHQYLAEALQDLRRIAKRRTPQSVAWPNLWVIQIPILLVLKLERTVHPHTRSPTTSAFDLQQASTTPSPMSQSTPPGSLVDLQASLHCFCVFKVPVHPSLNTENGYCGPKPYAQKFQTPQGPESGVGGPCFCTWMVSTYNNIHRYINMYIYRRVSILVERFQIGVHGKGPRLGARTHSGPQTKSCLKQRCA